MEDIITEIADLFAPTEGPWDQTGYLAGAARLLESTGPRLVFLADRRGNVIAADNLQPDAAFSDACSLARELSRRLDESDPCLIQEPCGMRTQLAFGLRLSAVQRQGILGAVVRFDERAAGRLEEMWPVLRICGALAFCAVGEHLEVQKLRTRVRHLLSEQNTLKISHTEAIGAAIEEHDQRLRAQQERIVLEESCRAAEAASRAKSEFLANMSHEFRTPLHGILSFATFGIKKADNADRDALLKYFRRIDDSATSLLSLVNDLLDLSKLESGREVFEFNRTALEPMVLSVIDEFALMLDQRGMGMEYHPPDSEVSVTADSAKIQQVLRNLLSNAVKFSADGSVIDVCVKRQGALMAVSVLDRGVGIPERELEAVFDKFIQSTKTRTGAGGTGLGLSISKEIIKAHQGRIWAENRPDGGAVFTFELPVHPKKKPAPLKREPTSSDDRLGPITDTSQLDAAALPEVLAQEPGGTPEVELP